MPFRSGRIVGTAFVVVSSLAACGGDSGSAPELSAPAKLTLVSGDAQSVANAPAPAPLPLIVKVTDPKDRAVSGVTVAWSASDPTASLSAPTSTTDAQGQAQITWTLGASNGTQSVTATTTAVSGARVVFQAKNAVTSITGSVTTSATLPLAFSANRAPARGRLSTKTYSSRAMSDALASHRAPLRRVIVQLRPSLAGASRAFVTAARDIAASRDAIYRMVSRYQAIGLIGRVEISPAIMAARVAIPDSVDMPSAMATLARDASVASVEADEIVPMLGDYQATEATAVRAPADARPAVGSAQGTAVKLPNDPLFLDQYWHYNLVDAFKVWPANTGSADVLVAVVDQGVRFDHPSMAANFTTDGYNFVAQGDRLTAALPICASSGGGTSALTEVGPGTDPTLPDDFLGISNAGCLVRNTAGDHGLHVSGTIGAPGNDAVGAVGLNWAVKIRPVRVLDETGSGSFFDIAQGVLYAAGLPAAGAGGTPVSTSPAARVINLSLGGSTDSPVMRAAIAAATDAGSLIVASAGNSSTNAPAFPASYPQVLAVVALGPDLQLASYTNVGSNVSLAAPGGDFRNCCGGGGGVLSTTYNYVSKTPNYAFYTGTSMAAPHVTGVAALLLASNPALTNTQVRQRLQSTAVDIGAPGRDDRYGYGIVNAFNAINNITSASSGRATFVRVIDAATGDTVRTVATAGDGSYSATRLPAGNYYVVAGEDEAGDKTIGVAGRRFGWFGGAAPSPIALTAGQTAAASIVAGTPVAAKPNGTFATATRLWVNSYVIDQVTSSDPIATYTIQIPRAATYVFETSGVLGTCGLGLELDTSIELYDSTQTLKAKNDNVASPSGVFCSQISTALTPGAYYLRVFQSPAAAGAAGAAGGQFRVGVWSAP